MTTALVLHQLGHLTLHVINRGVAGLSYTFLRNPIRNHYKSSEIIQKYVLQSINIGTLRTPCLGVVINIIQHR